MVGADDGLGESLGATLLVGVLLGERESDVELELGLLDGKELDAREG
jgi:hypothetical protein